MDNFFGAFLAVGEISISTNILQNVFEYSFSTDI